MSIRYQQIISQVRKGRLLSGPQADKQAGDDRAVPRAAVPKTRRESAFASLQRSGRTDAGVPLFPYFAGSAGANRLTCSD